MPSGVITTQVYQLNLPLADDTEHFWKPYQMFEGSTHVVEGLTCHSSVLSPGHSPHPPHSHEEEELLIALQGEAELIISDSPCSTYARTERLSPGSFVYYPARQHHTIHNPGVSPITYLMFKWRGAEFVCSRQSQTRIVKFSNFPPDNSKSFHACPILEQSTGYLEKLHVHLSTMQPGSGYAPHIDAYDVAILVLAGQIETLNKIVGPHGVIYYSAGQSHGLRNVGSCPAQYLVFEFHAPTVRSGQPLKSKTGRQLFADMLTHFGVLEPARRVRNFLR
jgi:mannose-6-phosphate isomerase-like protein (cupin superfamily)